jgi:transcriptional regulator with XRE-family HTH domain
MKNIGEKVMLDYKIIGGRIKEYRLKKCLSQEKLAEICNLSASHISRIETGHKNPSLETLIKSGNVLGVTADTFLVGFQKNNTVLLLDDCSSYEKWIILDVLTALKNSLRKI